LKNNLLVVALDATADKAIREMGLKSHLLAWDGGLSSLWKERVRFVRQLLTQGYDVIHSDADAIWLGNPVEYCLNLNVDAAFSQGTIWPPSVHEELGVVLCCGFFYLKSNEHTIHLLEQWYESVLIDGDDQRALNELLLERGLSWPGKEDYCLSWQGKSFKCFNDVKCGSLPGSMKLALLPHWHFQRLPEGRAPIVKHLLAASKQLE